MESKKARLLEEKVQAYFASHREILRGKDGQALTNALGAEKSAYTQPLTVSGLALALGFSSREELCSIRDKESAKVISRALLVIEEAAEEKLFSKESYSGTKLFLSVNFPRWRAGAPARETEPLPGEYESWAN